jgi:signal peptidase I
MRRPGGHPWPALLLLLLAVAAPWLARVWRSWPSRVAVAGHSMEPTLLAGDWLLVDPAAFVGRPPVRDDLVVAADPHDPGRWLVKRVGEVQSDGRFRLAGDHPGHASDTSRIGPVVPAAVGGRPWFRYWPPRRVGRIH